MSIKISPKIQKKILALPLPLTPPPPPATTALHSEPWPCFGGHLVPDV